MKFPYQGADEKMMLAGMSVDVTPLVTREAMSQDTLRDKCKLAEELEARKHIIRSSWNTARIRCL